MTRCLYQSKLPMNPLELAHEVSLEDAVRAQVDLTRGLRSFRQPSLWMAAFILAVFMASAWSQSRNGPWPNDRTGWQVLIVGLGLLSVFRLPLFVLRQRIRRRLRRKGALHPWPAKVRWRVMEQEIEIEQPDGIRLTIPHGNLQRLTAKDDRLLFQWRGPMHASLPLSALTEDTRQALSERLPSHCHEALASHRV